jgi:hypothetical protein
MRERVVLLQPLVSRKSAYSPTVSTLARLGSPRLVIMTLTATSAVLVHLPDHLGASGTNSRGGNMRCSLTECGLVSLTQQDVVS